MEIERCVYQMMEILLDSRGLQKLCDKASEILHSPVWVLDPNFHFLCVARGSCPVDSNLESMFDSMSMSPESMTFLHDRKLVETVNGQNDPYSFFDEVVGACMLVAPIKIKGIVIGSLSACRRKEQFSDEQIAFFAKVRDIISLELQRNRYSVQEKRTPGNAIFAELLERQGKTIDHVRNRLNAMKYKIGDQSRILIIYRRNHVDRVFPWYIIEAQIDRIFPGCLHTLYQYDLVVLLNEDKHREAWKRDEFVELLRAGNLKVGISYSIGSIYEICNACKDTGDLIEACEKAIPDVRMYRYDELATVLAVWYISDKMHWASLANGAVKKLSDYDAKNEQEMLKTLEVFAMCAFDVKRAADQLHVHENTLRYRINRIREITGIDFTDARDLQSILLALTNEKMTPTAERTEKQEGK